MAKQKIDIILGAEEIDGVPWLYVIIGGKKFMIDPDLPDYPWREDEQAFPE